MKRRSVGALLLAAFIAAVTVAQTTPAPNEAAVLDTTRKYVAQQKLELAPGSEPEAQPLGGVWYRVRLQKAGPPSGPIYKVLLVSSGGNVVDPEIKSAADIIAEIAGDAQNDADFARHAAIYFKAHSGFDVQILAGAQDIPGYDKAPLAKDLEAAVRAPWSIIKDGDRMDYVCYTYQQVGGFVERWVFTFIKGRIWRLESIRFPGRIGNAITFT